MIKNLDLSLDLVEVLEADAFKCFLNEIKTDIDNVWELKRLDTHFNKFGITLQSLHLFNRNDKLNNLLQMTEDQKLPDSDTVSNIKKDIDLTHVKIIRDNPKISLEEQEILLNKSLDELFEIQTESLKQRVKEGINKFVAIIKEKILKLSRTMVENIKALIYKTKSLEKLTEILEKSPALNNTDGLNKIMKRTEEVRFMKFEDFKFKMDCIQGLIKLVDTLWNNHVWVNSKKIVNAYKEFHKTSKGLCVTPGQPDWPASWTLNLDKFENIETEKGTWETLGWDVEKLKYAKTSLLESVKNYKHLLELYKTVELFPTVEEGDEESESKLESITEEWGRTILKIEEDIMGNYYSLKNSLNFLLQRFLLSINPR